MLGPHFVLSEQHADRRVSHGEAKADELVDEVVGLAAMRRHARTRPRAAFASKRAGELSREGERQAPARAPEAARGAR
jgi:hypothetical protein